MLWRQEWRLVMAVLLFCVVFCKEIIVLTGAMLKCALSPIVFSHPTPVQLFFLTIQSLFYTKAQARRTFSYFLLRESWWHVATPRCSATGETKPKLRRSSDKTAGSTLGKIFSKTINYFIHWLLQGHSRDWQARLWTNCWSDEGHDHKGRREYLSKVAFFCKVIMVIFDYHALACNNHWHHDDDNYLREVEEFLHTHPDVSEAQVRLFKSVIIWHDFVSSDRSSCSRPISTFSHNLLTLLKISL